MCNDPSNPPLIGPLPLWLLPLLQTIVAEHEIRNISCAAQDPDDLRSFAYITKDLKSGHHFCHVFSTVEVVSTARPSPPTQRAYWPGFLIIPGTLLVMCLHTASLLARCLHTASLSTSFLGVVTVETYAGDTSSRPLRLTTLTVFS